MEVFHQHQVGALFVDLGVEEVAPVRGNCKTIEWWCEDRSDCLRLAGGEDQKLDGRPPIGSRLWDEIDSVVNHGKSAQGHGREYLNLFSSSHRNPPQSIFPSPPCPIGTLRIINGL